MGVCGIQIGDAFETAERRVTVHGREAICGPISDARQAQGKLVYLVMPAVIRLGAAVRGRAPLTW